MVTGKDIRSDAADFGALDQLDELCLYLGGLEVAVAGGGGPGAGVATAAESLEDFPHVDHPPGSAATDDGAGFLVVYADDEYRIGIDDGPIHADDRGQHRYFFVGFENIDADGEVIDRDLFGILHHGEQNVSLQLLVGRIEKK